MAHPEASCLNASISLSDGEILAKILHYYISPSTVSIQPTVLPERVIKHFGLILLCQLQYILHSLEVSETTLCLRFPCISCAPQSPPKLLAPFCYPFHRRAPWQIGFQNYHSSCLPHAELNSRPLHWTFPLSGLMDISNLMYPRCKALSFPPVTLSISVNDTMISPSPSKHLLVLRFLLSNHETANPSGSSIQDVFPLFNFPTLLQC